MADPVIAHRKGYYFELKAGQRYAWCSCGRSQQQPFCDNSHRGTEFRPVIFEAERDQDVIFCGCKRTQTAPFCDGAHNNLTGGYAYDDPNSAANQKIQWVTESDEPITRLDGGCYVFRPSKAGLGRRAPNSEFAYTPIVSPRQGARFQSQFYVELQTGSSPVISADDRDTVLFVASGDLEVEIGSESLAVPVRSGVYIRPDEAFRLINRLPGVAKVFISNGPGSDDLRLLAGMPTLPGSRAATRVASVNAEHRHKMADRHYQLLINRVHGSTSVTQFIGNIPLSKGEPHRHLYEEALIILSGSGVVWSETTKTALSAGDVLFLARKQLHSVQCTSEEGMDVVGVIYPGDNPTVNY